MPAAPTHIIRRQRLDAEVFGTEADGLAVQRGLARICQHRLTPALQELLDRLAPARGHWQIERLEVDAGVLALADLEQGLVAAVVQAVEAQLSGQAASGSRHTTERQSVFEAFGFFLATGLLPWWFRLAGGVSLEQAILAALPPAGQPGAASFDADLRAILADEAARRRLVRQFSPAFLETLLARLSPTGWEAVREILAVLGGGATMQSAASAALWEAAFALAVDGKAQTAHGAVALGAEEMREEQADPAAVTPSPSAAFLRFLRDGLLPAGFGLAEGVSLERTILAALPSAGQPGAASFDAGLRAILANGAARRRLVRQFSPAFLETLLARLSPTGLEAVREILAVLGGGATMQSAPNATLWEAAFALAVDGKAQALPAMREEQADPAAVTPAPSAAFLCFLRDGLLPAGFELAEGVSLEQAILAALPPAGQPGAVSFDADLRAILADEAARRRLVRQFSPAFLETLLARLSPTGLEAVREVLALLGGGGAIPLASTAAALWEAAFALAVDGKAQTALALLAKSWRSLPLAEWRQPGLGERADAGLAFDAPVKAAHGALALGAGEMREEQAGPAAGNPAPLAAFLCFLRDGLLPAGFGLAEGVSLEQAILAALPSAGQPGAASFDADLRAILADEAARRRLVRQFSSGFLETLSARLSSATAGAVREALVAMAASPAEPGSLADGLWELALALAGQVEPLAGSVPAAEGAATKRAAPAQLAPAKWARAADPAILKEGIYVNCAGLVLLHPFLPRFFEALGIAQEDKLLRPERALCLLHFLVTGEEFAPEYELALPKLLCNVPLSAPVAARVGLTEAEREESAALLAAVIRHWEVLRDTGPDGLRGAFLRRQGKLSEREDGDHLLQVETQSFDILLDSLPWGRGIVRLPWMDRMLWVEWEH